MDTKNAIKKGGEMVKYMGNYREEVGESGLIEGKEFQSLHSRWK